MTAPVSFRVNPDVRSAHASRTSPPASRRASSASPSPRLRRCTAAPRRCRTSRCAASTATSARRSPTCPRAREAAAHVFEPRRPHRGGRHRARPRRPRRRNRHPLPRRGDDRPAATTPLAVRRDLGARRHRLLFEPGRFLVGNAGILLARVLYLKPGDDRITSRSSTRR